MVLLEGLVEAGDEAVEDGFDQDEVPDDMTDEELELESEELEELAAVLARVTALRARRGLRLTRVCEGTRTRGEYGIAAIQSLNPLKLLALVVYVIMYMQENE